MRRVWQYPSWEQNLTDAIYNLPPWKEGLPMVIDSLTGLSLDSLARLLGFSALSSTQHRC